MSLVALAAHRRRAAGIVFVLLLTIAFLHSGFDHEYVTDPSYQTYSNGSTLGNGSFTYDDDFNLVRLYHSYDRPGFTKPFANGIPLRIMCLGASTTRGDSPEDDIDNNGFRRPLRAKLTAAGNPANFVGTQRLGNMTDNDVEAYPGVQIDAIHGNARRAAPRYNPNLFVVNAGSNDCYMHNDIDNFYKRYDAMIEYLLSSPTATIIICTITPTWLTEHSAFDGRADMLRINPQIRRLYQIYRSENKPVVLVDMQAVDGLADENIAWDGMHPKLAGYEMMATKIFYGIVEADAKGFLQPPVPMTGIPDDGEDAPGRKDDEYLKAQAEQKKSDEAAAKLEKSEVENMKLELRKSRDKAAKLWQHS